MAPINRACEKGQIGILRAYLTTKEVQILIFTHFLTSLQEKGSKISQIVLMLRTNYFFGNHCILLKSPFLCPFSEFCWVKSQPTYSETYKKEFLLFICNIFKKFIIFLQIIFLLFLRRHSQNKAHPNKCQRQRAMPELIVGNLFRW